MKLYVVPPGGNRDYADATRAAGAAALLDPAVSTLDGHSVAAGSTGSQTLRLVEGLVAQGEAPIARGGLDTPTIRACLEAGAVGFVLEASLWLLPESPLPGRDRAAMERLTLADFHDGDVVLPSGLGVGRDALLAPFVARRHGSLSAAVRSFRESFGGGRDDGPQGGLTGDALPAPARPTAVDSTLAEPGERPEPTDQTTGDAATHPLSSVSNGHSGEDVLELVLELIAKQTGYPRDVLDPALDMEADLGIDTVKQAELFGALRERYQLARDEGIRLKDYRTIGKVAGYIASRLSPQAEADTHVPTSRGGPRASTGSRDAPDTGSPPSPDASGESTPAFETEPLEDAVAIIGLGAILPKANDVRSFWENVLNGVDAIVEVPKDRWDPAIHYDPDPTKEDKTYSKIGGFVTDFTFDPVRFRIPPSTARALDPVQQMALAAAAEALADAGYDQKPFDRTRCAVIIGNSLGGERKDETSKRLHLAEFAAALHRSAASEEERDLIERVAAEVRSSIPPITEDTMPGELSNVIAGRLANALNLGGKNLTTDAACASSHAALDTAVKAILAGEADMVLCGGADRSMDASTFVKFCKMGALSAKGSTPFDARADGFVMGEGAAILVLKRLSDAIRDEDRIYAVVRGLGASSDGKGKGITAPRPEGQKLAVRRAYQSAGLEPRHVQLLEAHGTSTRVGDVVEMEAAAELFGGLPPGSVALGSVKSQIGHLKSAAGAAGLMKAALALHHKVLPPSINFRTPNPNVDWAEVPFLVNTEARPWPSPSNGEPRRAAVSAFGFGGTNFHAVLEEFVPQYHARRSPEQRPARQELRMPSPAIEPAGAIGRFRRELVVIGARSPAELATAAREAAAAVRAATTLNEGARRARTADPHLLPHRLALGGEEPETLADGLETASTLVADPAARQALSLKVIGAAYGEGPRHAGKVAFLFPGQGSQYGNMCSELASLYPTVHRTFSEADQVLEPLLGATLSSLLFVDPANPEAVARSEDCLKQTEVTQPAMLTADVALFRLLADCGVEPDMVAGHSLGEYAALVAAGVLTFQDALLAVSARGREMANVHIEDKGLMAGFACGPDEAEEILRHIEGYVIAANKNCPVQTVVAGATDAVRQAMEVAAANGVETMMLPVSAAFHTSIVAPASEPLRRVLDRLDVHSPVIPVYANVNAEPYPDDPDEIRDLLARQVAAPVEWVGEMNAMYEAGCRIFIEVGPKRALAGFVDATLGGRPGALSMITNHPKRGDLASFYDALAGLAALGFDLDLPTEQDSSAIPAAQPSAVADASATAARSSADRTVSNHGYEAFREAMMPSIEGALKAGYARLADDRKALQDALAAIDRYGLVAADVVVSGAAMGLPGESHPVFHDDNAERLFAGENRIDRLDPGWADRFIDMGIVRLVKDDGEPRMEPVSDSSEVLKLAGRRGRFDIERDYGVPANLVNTLDITSKLGIAVAYEALRDAGIPMVQETIVTKNGGTLPGDWGLPPEMQDETGVVFASAFPGYDNFVREISRHLTRRLAGRTLSELDALYHELLEALPVKKRGRVSRFYAQHAGELHRLAGDESALEGFNRNFLFSIMSMGHAELAEAIKARGPNTQVNAACSSSTQALAVAEDWIRTGRCRRVIVVGADDVTTDNLLEWIGSGFLASGAATTAETVEEGALPFDRRRHGMIMGMGAAGLVLERREDVEDRGMIPVARLVATRVANGAYHGSRLHVGQIAKEAADLVRTSARRLGTSPEALAAETLFVSHETYTPARGGSAAAEASALRAAFGPGATDVLVSNTKGFTGHTMGAGIEDALAVKSLQYGKVPPIANLRDVDPEFADLNFSRGGVHSRRHALRFSAGFGSQIALAFFEKIAEGDRRVMDRARYQSFLDRVAGAAGAKAERVGRVLRVGAAQATPEPVPMRRGGPETTAIQSSRPLPPSEPAPLSEPAALSDLEAVESSKEATTGGGRSWTADDVLGRVVALVADKTGYPPEVLDPALDMEGDLGIDTVKQAEIFAQIRDEFSLPREEGISLKDYPTLAKVAEYMASRLGTLPSERGLAPAHEPGRGGSKVGARTRIGPSGAAEPQTGQVAPSSATETLRRRVPRIAAAPANGRVERSAFVVGRGDLADALRSDLPGSGGQVAVFVGAARELFVFARANAGRLESGELGLLAVTHLGGTHGIDRSRGAEDGGVTGMAKALAAEFPRAFVRALDLDASDDLARRISHVREELRLEGTAVEVGRSKRGRVVVRTVEAGRTGSDRPSLPPGCVILATGGARGIAAEALEALADQHPTMVLLGRTPAPREDEADLDDGELAQLKDRAKEQLAARGEQPTPVAIERAVAPFRSRAEVAVTLRKLRAAGASVEYHSVDVSDAEALGRVVRDVRTRHGRIDGVLHAAGIEESKRLADKDEGAFDRTWKPKAGAAMTLARLTRHDDVRFFVMFGSVAGRFGNAAQTDYSAANDACAKLARVLRGRGVPASVFAWGPWGEKGMATRGSALTVLRAAGVEPISTREGVGAFLSELAHLDEPEVVLAKSLGGLEVQHPSSGRRFTRTLRADDPEMDHHRVDGVPYLAGALGVHLLSEAAGGATHFEDVRFEYPVKLLRDLPTEITVAVDESGLGVITTVPPGPAKEPKVHFRAQLSTPGEPPSGPRRFEGAAWTFDRIYPPLFHGPAYRVLDRATGVSVDGTEVEGADPGFGIPRMASTIEGALQSLGLWGLAVAGTMGLPEKVGRIAIWGPFDPGATAYRVFGARVAEGRVVGDVECVVRGRVVASLKGLSLIDTVAGSTVDPPEAWRAEEVELGKGSIVRVPVEDARQLLDRPELLGRWLSEREREVVEAFPVAKRRQEWLAATLAAKSALRRAGDAREWTAMAILRGDDGIPLPHGSHGLTLSHAGSVAVARVFDASHERVGVDVEPVRARTAKFEEEAFTIEERASFPEGEARPAAVTMAWCAKEATLKALGLGLSVDLHSVITRRTRNGISVEAAGEAKERIEQLEGTGLTVVTRLEGDSMAVASATLIQRH